MRTRNPCVFFRRRLLGWYVRFPFMVSYTKVAGQVSGRNSNTSDARETRQIVLVQERGRTRVCYSPLFPAARQEASMRPPFGFLPKISTTCGNHCGKGGFPVIPFRKPRFPACFQGAKAAGARNPGARTPR